MRGCLVRRKRLCTDLDVIVWHDASKVCLQSRLQLLEFGFDPALKHLVKARVLRSVSCALCDDLYLQKDIMVEEERFMLEQVIPAYLLEREQCQRALTISVVGVGSVEVSTAIIPQD